MTAARSRSLPVSVALLISQGPPWETMGETTLTTLLQELTPSPVAHGHLLRYLNSTTRFAGDADPMMPRIAQKLLRIVRDAGHPVAIPLCPHCGADRMLTQAMHDGTRVCNICALQRHSRPCDQCGKDRPVCRNLDGVTYCNTCWRRQPGARKICIRCGRLGLTRQKTPEGPLCDKCAPGKLDTCVHCGNQRRVRARYLGGATCESCFNRIRRTRRVCPSCGTKTLVSSLGPDGRTLMCSPCAGVTSTSICRRCGVEDIRRDSRCYRCAATDSVNKLFDTGTPARRALLEPVRIRLIAHPEPKTMVQWPHRSKSGKLLGAMLREELDVTHQALDDSTVAYAPELLRRILVDVAVLEPRDEGWAGFDRWLHTFLRGQPRHILDDLGPYCRWGLRSRTRLAIARRGVNDGTFSRARRHARTAQRFLTYLHEHGQTLAGAPQSTLEDYLADHPRDVDCLRLLTGWAAETNSGTRMRTPPVRNEGPTAIYSTEDYRAWVHRFETDETIPLRARISGLISATTGRPSSVTARLTRSGIQDDGHTMTLSLGSSRVHLRAPLPDLIRQQIAAPRRWDVESDWLFPSLLRVGQHVDYSNFTRDLHTIGCHTVPLRGAALLNLAATLAIGPLCDVTGISPAAAVRWQTAAAAAFADYPALRRRETIDPRDQA